MEALVCSESAFLHKDKNVGSVIEDEVLHGMKIFVLDMENEWYFVETHYRYRGYIHQSNLFFEPEYIRRWDSAPHSVVIRDFADVMESPKYQGRRMACLVRGAQVVATDIVGQDGWGAVQLADGCSGYIRTSSIAPAARSLYVDKYAIERKNNRELTAKDYIERHLCIPEAKFRRKVTKTARQYLGVQYRWGGKSPLGIDCSGLCSIAYMLNGINIYRDAAVRDGFPVKEIGRENLAEGDLLFFPGHIAMYLDGGKYIHSTGRAGSDGVVVNSLNPGDMDYREDLAGLWKTSGSVFW